MIFELIKDFADVIEAMEAHDPSPESDTRLHRLRLMSRAIRRESAFLDRHPTALFQCLWNHGWWHDCEEGPAHYPQEDHASPYAPWVPSHHRLNVELSSLLERWRSEKTFAPAWLRDLRPPAAPLGSAQWAVLRNPSVSVSQVFWSPDGKQLYSCSDEGLCIWDTDTCALGNHFRHLAAGDTSLSTDGRELICSRGIFDAQSGEKLASFADARVSTCDFSPDSSQFVVGCHPPRTARVLLMDIADGTSLELAGDMNRVECVRWSPDGDWIAAAVRVGEHDSGTHVIHVWDAHSGDLHATLSGHDRDIACLVWRPDGAILASGSHDRTVRFWNVAERREISVKQIDSLVYAVDWHPRADLLAVGTGAGDIQIWNAPAGGRATTYKAHEKGVRSVVYSPGGSRFASCSFDSMIRIWDAWELGDDKTLADHIDRIETASFSPDGRRLATGGSHDDATVRIWNTTTGVQECLIDDLKDLVRGLVWSPDGACIAACCDAGVLGAWDAATGFMIHRLKGHRGAAKCVAWSPDGNEIASGSTYFTVRIWDTTLGETIATLEGHESSVVHVCYSPDGTLLASASLDETIRVWSRATWQLEATLQGFQSPRLLQIAWTDDRRQIMATRKGQTVMVWDLAQEHPLAKEDWPPSAAENTSIRWQEVHHRYDDSCVMHTDTESRISWIPLPEQLVASAPTLGVFAVGDRHLHLLRLENAEHIDLSHGGNTAESDHSPVPTWGKSVLS